MTYLTKAQAKIVAKMMKKRNVENKEALNQVDFWAAKDYLENRGWIEYENDFAEASPIVAQSWMSIPVNPFPTREPGWYFTEKSPCVDNIGEDEIAKMVFEPWYVRHAILVGTIIAVLGIIVPATIQLFFQNS